LLFYTRNNSSNDIFKRYHTGISDEAPITTSYPRFTDYQIINAAGQRLDIEQSQIVPSVHYHRIIITFISLIIYQLERTEKMS